MVQGTGSYVGKSLMVTALCRIFNQDGFRVAPFKAQNMSLNSCATPDGREIGRAQAVQAEACGIAPTSDMNPILLKPTGDAGCQVVLNGRPYTTLSAEKYYALREVFWKAACESLGRLKETYDIVVIEGAGSPAEVNLRDKDIVNMRMAKYAGAPVLLVGDIDRGGVFAWIVGTLELLPEDERELIRGILINKFRGDISLLRPGLRFLEERTGRPVVGVIPYINDLRVQEEDSVALDGFRVGREAEVKVAVVRLPRISNFTDFDPLISERDVSLRYIKSPEELKDADIIVIPGTKGTIYDLLFLRETGLAERIIEERGRGAMVVGICGGFQILGKRILDPYGVESELRTAYGLGLLDVVTVFAENKATYRAKAKVIKGTPYLEEGEVLEGYEIHMGQTEAEDYMFELTRESGGKTYDGVASEDGMVFGTYLHGIFENNAFRRRLLNFVRKKKGFPELPPSNVDPISERQGEYDRIADVVRGNIDMDFIYGLLGV